MRVSEVLYEIMAYEGMSCMGMSKQLGKKSKNDVRNKIQRDYGMSVESLIELCDVLGAQVIIRYYDEEYELGE